MAYPAIVYTQDRESVDHADNLPYRRTRRYMVTVMDRNPDSLIAEKVANLPQCTFERAFTADQLNHKVYSLYY